MSNYDRELNKGMKVFSQLFVGLMEQSKGQCDLGFATPYEDNAAGRKRQETVKGWRTGAYWDHEAKEQKIRHARTKIIDNKPRGGFKITDDIKRVYWGGGNVVFRVYDPEGFELEIQSQNLMAIIQVAGINEGGVIPGYCLWGRDGGNNILLHEKSDEYKNALLAAETLKPIKQTAAAARVPGTKYLLQDGREGVYLGRFWIIRDDYRNDVPYATHCKAKIGPYTTHGKLQERKMGEPEAFDAVDVGTREEHIIRLYKKAPLIRSIGEIIAQTPETCLTMVHDAVSISFASSSMRGRIAFIHNAKFHSYKYVTEKMRESIFKARLKKITDPGNSYYVDRRRSLSAASFHGFYGGGNADATIIVYRPGDKLYSHFSEICGPFHDVATFHAGWPVVVADKLISEFIVDQYALSNLLLSNLYRSAGQVQNDCKLFECIQLPSFLTLAEVGEWYTQQYEQGNLLEIRVQPMENENE